MAPKEEISRFLADFKTKMDVYNVVYMNREKNLQALSDLDIRPFERTAYLKSLEVESYYRGPLPDQAGISDLWEFGIPVKGKEVYIKIQLGAHNRSTICISFHLAEFPMTYPYKKP
ncbi:type II toxin-antitoxin system MqsR family toxin [Larkinella humicola]|uniref:Type II toxin-antitoxin system MqsR family toxin n=1 Tax=Larkinella humicola TaxID=2607654 RepID=A0A5N1J5R6_9BACT|nr:type II toxin-antitoxin system MqsR family toxin [Larkinella humicola]KAA9341144.1 type II toxin-antitoxin system MqsR family toxin [Larkinella humicola]